VSRPRSGEASAQGQLSAFRERLRAFEAELSAGGLPSPQLADQLSQLKAALEEVDLADEALASQAEELIAAREALESERQRYRNLFHLAPYGYLATDLDGTILEANRTALELLQVTAQAIRRKPLAVFVARADVSRFRQLVARLRDEDQVADWEVVLCPRRRPPITAVVLSTIPNMTA